ncbi:MAG TPA: COQ9 family protein [Alphaproteobacteria bacterium]|nr:COQ9 family protein [Alphaproteobacteria bacterium]
MSGKKSFETMRARILECALVHVPFDGWSEKSLMAGAKDAGYAPPLALDAFPGGVPDAIEFASERADAAMLDACERSGGLKEKRVRERIAAAVRLRLELSLGEREAIRRALAFLALPQNAPLGLKLVWRTVDAIWYAAGDSATDFNFYTKRALLTGVYSATMLYWLNDSSPGSAETWRFLDRRIEEALSLPRLLGSLRERIAALPRRFRAPGPARHRPR